MSDLAADAALGIGLTDSKPAAETSTKNAAVNASRRRKARKEKLLITVLPVIITGATFVLSFSAQLWQQHVQSRETRDSEWRKALQQVSSKDTETAIQGAYEMESFLDDSRYGSQARAIAADLLPSITDHRSFDLIFANLLEKANQQNQSEFIAVDVALTDQLEDEYYKAIQSFNDLSNVKAVPADKSFPGFLMHPDRFYSEDAESDKLAYVLSKTWELDTVSHGLARLWSRHSNALSPDGQFLSDMVFFNNDFSNVDFRHTREMDDIQFIGGCRVDQAMLPSDIKPGCQTPAPETMNH